MVVIQTAVCVCLLGGGRWGCPFTPPYYAYYTDLLGCFCSGNRLLLFFTPPPLSLYPIDTFFSLVTPPLRFLSHSSPEVMGKGERGRETGQAYAVENNVYAPEQSCV